MKQLLNLALIFLFVAFSFAACQQKGGQVVEQKPNIVFIMADDLGYGDLGAYNPTSKIPTPNLDALAAEGIRFTDAYCPVSVCTPTRYALMTGQYPWRSWKKVGVVANYQPSMMADEAITLPEMLRQGGYTTAGFGKWHLGAKFPTLDGKKPAGYGKFFAEDNGSNLDFSKPVSDGPLDHGFDTWYGFSCASECWVFQDKKVKAALLHDLYTIEQAPGYEQLEQIPLSEYLPVITNKSIGFLKDHAQKKPETPFFLYYAPYVPHIPLAVDSNFIGKTEAGLYGDYVHELDFYIGKLLDELEKQGLSDNTLVLFASDNGSQFEFSSPELDMANATNYADDVVKTDIASQVHRPNYPLRGTKWLIYEGGVRTPLIARWPDHFPQDAESRQLIGLMDVMRTLSSVVEVDLPDGQAKDSYDLLPAFYGKTLADSARESIALRASNLVYGLRRAQWKFIKGDTLELYDLSADVGETKNLIDDYPEVAAKLEEELDKLVNIPSAPSSE